MEFISKIFYKIKNDSLYSNSIYLMLSTAIMAFFGFFFWIINAKLYSSQQVGIATTLISVVTLISGFSLLGLGVGLIRYLPTSENKNKIISTAFSLIGLLSITLSALFLIMVAYFSPTLVFIRTNIIFSLIFILTVFFSSLHFFSESIFVAYRASYFVTLKNTILSILKLFFTFFFTVLGAYGIFLATGIASIVAFLFCLIILLWKFNYVVRLIIDTGILKKVAKFSLANYVAGFIGGLPSTILPLIIINTLGAKVSAYFYMDLMIANLLYIIPLATSQSLFAEGSHNEGIIKNHVKKAMKIIVVFLIPVIIVMLFLGKYILLAFGKEYSSGGFAFLQLLAISAVFMSVNYVGNAISNIKHKIHYVVILNTITTCIILALSYLSIHNGNGLTGIGVSWVIGQAVTAMIYLYILKFVY